MERGGTRSCLCAILLLIILGGCAPVAASPAGAAASAPAVIFTAIPSFTAPAPTLAPPVSTLPSPRPPAALGDLFVTVSADNVNLRTRPGTVFPVSRLLAKGTRLQLLGHAPGEEWLYVQTDSKVAGWVLTWLVTGGHDGGPTPEVTPGDVLVVRGKVVDRAGVPISGIGYAVTQGTGSKALRTDASTDQTGQFYAYLPANATGTWSVSHVAVSCASNTMDTNCNCIGACGRSDPEGMTISLPAQEVLEFVWR